MEFSMAATRWSSPTRRWSRPIASSSAARRGRGRPHRRGRRDAPGPRGGFDLEGDYLLPGLVELHTDHLEAHYMPRPRVTWHAGSAVLAYDAQIAAAGITTVFDSFRGRAPMNLTRRASRPEAALLADAIAERPTQICCAPTTSRICAANSRRRTSSPASTPPRRAPREPDLADGPLARTAAVPRYREILHLLRRQVRTVPSRPRRSGRRAPEHRRAFGRSKTGRASSRSRKARGIMLASHDDTTVEEVALARIATGVSIAEFPTTPEAASASREVGMATVMGAPNVVRGGSHSGNASARELAEAGRSTSSPPTTCPPRC